MENQERVAFINLATRALELGMIVANNLSGHGGGVNGFGDHETFSKAFREINQSIGKLTPMKTPMKPTKHKHLSHGKLNFVSPAADETEDEEAPEEEEEEEEPVKPKSKKQRVAPVFDDYANDGDDDEDDNEDDAEDDDEGDDDPECEHRYGEITQEQFNKLKALVEKGMEKNKLVTIRMVVPLLSTLFTWKGSYERRTKRKRGDPYTHQEMANIEMIASYIKLAMPAFGDQMYDYANPGGKKSSSGRIGTVSDAIACASAPITMSRTPLFAAFESDATLADVAETLAKCIISFKQTIVLGEAKKSAKATAVAVEPAAETPAKTAEKPARPTKSAKSLAAKPTPAVEPDVTVADDNGEDDGEDEEEEEEEKEEEEEGEDEDDDEDGRKEF